MDANVCNLDGKLATIMRLKMYNLIAGMLLNRRHAGRSVTFNRQVQKHAPRRITQLCHNKALVPKHVDLPPVPRLLKLQTRNKIQCYGANTLKDKITIVRYLSGSEAFRPHSVHV